MSGMGDEYTVDARGRGFRTRANVVTCEECGCFSGLRWAGWRAYRIDDPELEGPPALALLCPTCAECWIDYGAD